VVLIGLGGGAMVLLAAGDFPRATVVGLLFVGFAVLFTGDRIIDEIRKLRS
jgi:hypothetical protein